MKILAPLFVFAAMTVAGSQAQAQLSGGSGGGVIPPGAPSLSELQQMTSDAYNACRDAYNTTREAARVMELYGQWYGSRYATAAEYLNTAADFQLDAWWQVYYAHNAARNGGYVSVELLVRIADFAELAQTKAAWSVLYAMAADNTAGFDLYGAEGRTRTSYDKIELLVRTVDQVLIGLL